MKPAPTFERVWFGYLAAVMLVAWWAPGGGSPGHRPAPFLLMHVGMALAVFGSRWCHRRGLVVAARSWRVVLAIGGCPVVFSALGWLLPGVHPEPYEYAWLQLDRAWFGADIARHADGCIAPWGVELLQIVYACFYVLPIAAAVGAYRRSGIAAFDRCVVILVGSFLLSYLGYLLVPTLAPKVVLAHAAELEGVWLTPALRRSIDAAEANLWDCFPSGHTMLTLTSLILCWRWHRRWFWLLLAPALCLIASTMLLRYHWAIDVVAGAVLAWPAVRFADWLLDLDGWPRVARPGRVTPA